MRPDTPHTISPYTVPVPVPISTLEANENFFFGRRLIPKSRAKNTITPARLSALVNPKNPIVLMNISFLSALRHNTDYFLICLSHSIFSETAHVGDRIFHAFGHDTVAAFKLLAV